MGGDRGRGLAKVRVSGKFEQASKLVSFTGVFSSHSEVGVFHIPNKYK